VIIAVAGAAAGDTARFCTPPIALAQLWFLTLLIMGCCSKDASSLYFSIDLSMRLFSERCDQK
jgi:hypothetical protein